MKETLPYEMTRCSMRNRSLSVMILKIDRYDNFIHSYGSYTANKIFLAIANAVQIQLRGMDMAIKYDEGCIALLLIGTDESQSENVAKRIHTAVNQLVMGDQKLNEKFTLSVGVAEMAEEDYADLLIARTQAALDRAISEGGNQTSH
jgi:diguanylate cyclase (GGDEF)-like protein